MSHDYGVQNLPMNVPLDQQNFNTWVRSTLLNLQNALIPPSPVSNLRCTPQPGANMIDFTRSDGDSYTLYINTTPSINGSDRIKLGTSNRYTHNVGIAAIKYYYAIKPKKGVVDGEVSGWVFGTTLGLTTPATAVEPPPPTEFPFQDQETDSVEIAVPSAQDYFPV